MYVLIKSLDRKYYLYVLTLLWGNGVVQFFWTEDLDGPRVLKITLYFILQISAWICRWRRRPAYCYWKMWRFRNVCISCPPHLLSNSLVWVWYLAIHLWLFCDCVFLRIRSPLFFARQQPILFALFNSFKILSVFIFEQGFYDGQWFNLWLIFCCSLCSFVIFYYARCFMIPCAVTHFNYLLMFTWCSEIVSSRSLPWKFIIGEVVEHFILVVTRFLINVHLWGFPDLWC